MKEATRQVTYVYSRDDWRDPTQIEIDNALMEYATVCEGGRHPQRFRYRARNGVQIQAFILRPYPKDGR